MNYAAKTKKKLYSIIKHMSRDLTQFVKNPSCDFARNRKLPFGDMLKIILSLGANNTRSELLSFFHFKSDTASTSAFCQQRKKIKIEAFQTLFYLFNNTLSHLKTYKGYRVLACDGSTIPVPMATDDRIYLPQGGSPKAEGAYLHLNALYDVCNKTYVDIQIEPERINNEKSAFLEMLFNHSLLHKTIYIMDRGYESYNLMAHITNQSQYYLIRIKDNNIGGFARTYPHPDTDEYDVSYKRIFTKKRAKEYAEHPEIYTYVRHKYKYDFFASKNKSFMMAFRILRIEVSKGIYECFVTNLPSDEFDALAIKELYRMRWGIETSFRELKHTIGLLYFHSKKEEFIIQEIYAGLILYNYCQMVTSHATLGKKHRTYQYQLNYTMAIKLCCIFLKDNSLKNDIEKLIEKELLPIRPGRTADRNKCKHYKSFIYRV
jgi:hypothetical protein